MYLFVFYILDSWFINLQLFDLLIYSCSFFFKGTRSDSFLKTITGNMFAISAENICKNWDQFGTELLRDSIKLFSPI